MIRIERLTGHEPLVEDRSEQCPDRAGGWSTWPLRPSSDGLDGEGTVSGLAEFAQRCLPETLDPGRRFFPRDPRSWLSAFRVVCAALRCVSL
jgi:hypothetical protein